MNEAAAREILMSWKAHQYPGRLKTQQVELAEEIIKNAPPSKFTDINLLKELSDKQAEQIKFIHRSDQFNESEKIYLLQFHTQIKSFYDRYYQRLKRKKKK